MLLRWAPTARPVLFVFPLALAGACSDNSGTGGSPSSAATTSSTAGASGVATTSGGAGGSSAGAGGAEAAGASIDDASWEGSIEDATGSDAPIVAAFASQALEIAAVYKSWGRVDDEWRWAPFLCRLPLPGVARVSQSDDSTSHGQKLYSVFVKYHANYPTGPHTDQAVVKESWVPELVADAAWQPGSSPAVDGGNDLDGDHFYGYAKGEGGIYRAAAPAGLFIMFKVAPGAPDTDQGWVYATITTAGQVTAAGRVASCMGCHAVAEHERLFGVPLSPAQ